MADLRSRLLQHASTLAIGGIFVLAPPGARAACVFYQPWNCPSTSPDVRATYFAGQMTTAEKLLVVDGKLGLAFTPYLKKPDGALGSGGFVPGIARLNLPALQETDAGLGVADPVDLGTGIPMRGSAGYATALPSGPALAASFDPAMAFTAGAMIGDEASRQGFNVMLAGAMNLTRDPRGGRTFEYAGEDPLLAGTISGQLIRGVQSRHVISTMKHYAVNAQETGRTVVNASMASQALRESDLLSFEIALNIGAPGSVMCSYNKVNGAYACGSDYLLNQVLKQDWHYQGYVMSDWGAVHAATDANGGLDQESGDLADAANGGPFFTTQLSAALAAGTVPAARLTDMVRRILRSEFTAGIVDTPPIIRPLDAVHDIQVAQTVEAAGIVLLKNDRNLLPLSKAARRIVVIGSNANNGVLSGGGSSQVWPLGGPAQPIDPSHAFPHPRIWDPSAPLSAIGGKLAGGSVSFVSGASPSAAAAAAQGADAAIVFVNQWAAEGIDMASLALPLDPISGVNQDQLVSAVAAVNPNTIVVIESGGPVLMPWLAAVRGVVEAWYPGSGGGPAIASVLFGDSDAQGRLPMTFPANEAQLPRPVVDHGSSAGAAFTVNYDIEGTDIGYRWYFARKSVPLFPFGFGLSYTHFAYANLKLSSGANLTADFDVTNTGSRAGSDVPQLYLSANPGPAQPPRLLGFARVSLNAGATQHVTLAVDNRLLSRWSDTAHGFVRPAGSFSVMLSTSAATPVIAGSTTLSAVSLGP